MSLSMTILAILTDQVSRRCGVRAESLDGAALEKAAQKWLAGRGEALIPYALDEGDRALWNLLLEAAVVPETYFFRHPEHFSALRNELLARVPSTGLSFWSAGCATGEEAWTLAGLVRSLTSSPVEILGTDLAPERLAVARRGIYGARSLRVFPEPFEVFVPSDTDRCEVLPSLRPLVRFEVHNLLDPPPGLFDVVVCRNVLVYSTEDACAAIVRNLVRAVKPGGLLLLGALETGQVPQGMTPVGGVHSLFRKEQHAPRMDTPPTLPARPAKVPVVVEARLESSPAQRLEEALKALELGEARVARQLLEQLLERWPECLPARLELAVLLARRGETSRARAQAVRVIELAALLPPGGAVDGGGGMTPGFFVESAEALLRRLAPSTGAHRP